MRIGVAIAFLWNIPFAHGQKATERFIPLGKSPGLSGKHTIIGKIETINAQERTIAITDSAGSHVVKITDLTQIWLDKSKIQLTSSKGTFADLEKGLLVEVKYEDKDGKDKGLAEWIKVQITESGARSPAVRDPE
jgi:hypothetical protein